MSMNPFLCLSVEWGGDLLVNWCSSSNSKKQSRPSQANTRAGTTLWGCGRSKCKRGEMQKKATDQCAEAEAPRSAHESGAQAGTHGPTRKWTQLCPSFSLCLLNCQLAGKKSRQTVCPSEADTVTFGWHWGSETVRTDRTALPDGTGPTNWRQCNHNALTQKSIGKHSFCCAPALSFQPPEC